MSKPGSTRWLLAHEIRMFFYDFSAGVKMGKARRGMTILSTAIMVAAVLALHLAAWAVMRKLPPLDGAPPPMISMVAGIALILCMTLMISMGLKSSVSALFERGDLDLLLSSPLSSRTIFSVRLLAATIGVASLFLVLLSPVADVGLLLGQPRWLGIYPTIMALAAIAAALAMLSTLGLVKLIGVRKTRVLAQILSGLTGAAFFIATQISNPGMRSATGGIMTHIMALFAPNARFGPDSWLWLPGRALLGDPLPMLVLTLIGVAAFMFTVQFTHGFFVRGVQQSSGMGRAAKRPAGPIVLQFRSGVMRNTLIKEWKLIGRDPQLISQIFLQLLYMTPAYVVIFMRHQQQSMAMAAAGFTFLAASLCSSLTWITVSAEDAPDLLLSAPVKPITLRLAKGLAAFLPVFVLLLPLLVWVALQQPLQGLLMAACVYAGAACSGLTTLLSSRPGKRGAFKMRARGSWIGAFIEFFNGVLWAAVAYFSVWAVASGDPSVFGWHASTIAALALLAALAALSLAFVVRTKHI